jgi:membrane associated rhomboid family serine protease
MDLNHILFFTAVASSFVILLRTWRLSASWFRLAAALVLIFAAGAWLFVRQAAGAIAAIAWCAFLLIPSLARNRAMAARDPHRHRARLAITFSSAVTTLIIANAFVFVIEILAGGSTNPQTLHQLGELDTDAVRFSHEYWRMFTALFLHYGSVHLLFNLVALLVLGPPLERQIGSLVFTICYLVSGVGSSIAVVLLTSLRLTPAMQLVGASGCVMGIVGTWAGFLLRHRHAPVANRLLRDIAVIVGLQIAFDLTTPEVSMSAHLGGLSTGLLLGLALPKRFARGM